MKISTPEAQGISSKALERFVDKLKEQKIPVHSILMARHGHMVMEAYYQPYDKEKLHRMFSETKSYTSLGIGLLVSDGVIRLEDKICQYFPGISSGESASMAGRNDDQRYAADGNLSQYDYL